MDIRTFEAFSMKDAVKAVKKSLGADAVILSTKEKKASSGKGSVFEVTAAASHTNPGRSGASLLPSSRESHGIVLSEPDGGTQALHTRITNLCDQAPTRQQVGALEAGLSEMKALLIEALRGKDGSPFHGLPPYLVPIERQLRAMGVEEATIAELVRHLQNESIFEAGQTGEALESFYRDLAIRWLMKRIKIASRWPLISGSISIQALTGPTGTGKTSIIAKLAAHYSRKQKNKVKVVSVDQNRLAATEQMRVFCKILGIPFASATHHDELKKIVEESGEIDLMLIDTPGLSPKDEEGITRIQALRAQDLPIDFHLTLSVTEKEAQMDRSVRAFSKLGINSLIFTKLDESWGFGEIFNLGKRWGLPLSFFGIGRDIPEDLERATRERVVERIFGIS